MTTEPCYTFRPTSVCPSCGDSLVETYYETFSEVVHHSSFVELTIECDCGEAIVEITDGEVCLLEWEMEHDSGVDPDLLADAAWGVEVRLGIVDEPLVTLTSSAGKEMTVRPLADTEFYSRL